MWTRQQIFMAMVISHGIGLHHNDFLCAAIKIHGSMRHSLGADCNAFMSSLVSFSVVMLFSSSMFQLVLQSVLVGTGNRNTNFWLIHWRSCQSLLYICIVSFSLHMLVPYDQSLWYLGLNMVCCHYNCPTVIQAECGVGVEYLSIPVIDSTLNWMFAIVRTTQC